MDKRKRPRQQGGRGGASWSRQKKAKSGPALPRSLLQELGFQEKNEPAIKKKKSSDQNTTSRRSASKPREKQPGDPLSGSSQEAIQVELQLQATLAKKLKLKQGSTRTGPEDGLDDLLRGIEDLNGTIPSGELPELLDSDEEDPLLKDEGDFGLEGDSEEEGDASEDDESLDSDGMGALDDVLDGHIDSADEDDDDEEAVDFGDALGPAGGSPEAASSSSDEEGKFHRGAGALLRPAGKGACKANELVGGDASDAETGSDEGGEDGDDSEEEAPQLVATVQQSKQQPDAMYHFSRSTSAGAEAKYVPPAARRQATNAVAADSDTARQQSDAADKSKEERAAVRRKVRSLLNRVAVANLLRVASELADMFNAASKDVVATSIVDSIMQAVQDGPRAADQFAAVTSCVLVLTAVVANMQELLANAALALAQALQQARAASDSIAASNVVTIFCFLYSCGGVDNQLMYSLLDSMKASLSDGDVRLMLLVLQTVGQQLRAAEPNSFKALLEGTETKMDALASENNLSQRARLMLELIVEMKNSKKIKEKHGAGSLQSNLNAEVMQQLQSCNVERVALHSLTWEHVRTRLQLLNSELYMNS